MAHPRIQFERTLFVANRIRLITPHIFFNLVLLWCFFCFGGAVFGQSAVRNYSERNEMFYYADEGVRFRFQLFDANSLNGQLITVVSSANNKSSVDRVFHVRFVDDNNNQVDCDLTIRAGEVKGIVKLQWPIQASIDELSIEILRDQERVYRTEDGFSRRSEGADQAYRRRRPFSILRASSSENVDDVFFVFGSEYDRKVYGELSNPKRGFGQDRYFYDIEYTDVDAFPDSWHDYRSYDLVVLRLKELTVLCDSGRTRQEALRFWLNAGGSLAILDVESPADLKELQRLLTLAKIDTDFKKQSSQPEQLSFLRVFPGAENGFSSRALRGGSAVEIPIESLNGFRLSKYGDGEIVALPKIEGREEQIGLLRLANRNFDRLSPMRNSRQAEKIGFPGIDEHPTLLFMGVISLYLIVVGPVGYEALNRLKRLYMMLILPPIIGASVVVLFVLIMLFKDGVGRQDRVEAFTVIDSQAGIARTVSRHVLFSALGFGGEISFPRDRDVQLIGNEKTPCLVEVGEDELSFSEGEVRARGTPEFEIFDVRPSEAYVREIREQGKLVAIENKLGSAIKLFELKGTQGEYYLLRNIPEGRYELPTDKTSGSLSQEVAALFELNRQHNTKVLNDLSSIGYPSIERQYYDGCYYSNLFPDPSRLPKGHFFAVVEENPLSQIPKGYKRHSESHEFIVGTVLSNPRMGSE